MTLARYGHHMLARPFGERMVAIGDAFHAASPQLGQGANMALLDAQVLAHALSSMSDLQSALVLYGRRRRRQMVYYQVRAPDIRLKRRISAKPQHRINTTGISSC
jgi:2-polyprenyl-6-methoxyphenol hydroxylase-like FAD-dependent oxidoreductase